MKRLRCNIGWHQYAWVWSSVDKVSGGTMCIHCGKSMHCNYYRSVIFVQEPRSKP